MPLPLAMVICDAVYEDPITRKKTILGTFSALSVDEVPALIPQICAYAALTDTRGMCEVRAVIVDADEENPPLAEEKYLLEFSGPLTVLEIVFAFTGVLFPSEGVYRVQLFAGDQLLIERKISVE
jgi:hypothetical protein